MQYKPLSSLRRADQLFFEQISDRVTLAYGLAFHAPEFPLAVGDNAFREVLVESADALPAARAALSASLDATRAPLVAGAAAPVSVW